MVHPLIAFAFNCIRAFAGIIWGNRNQPRNTSSHPETKLSFAQRKISYIQAEKDYKMQATPQNGTNGTGENATASKFYEWSRVILLFAKYLGFLDGPLSPKPRFGPWLYKLTRMRDQELPALKQADQCAKCKLCSVAPILQLAPALTIVPRTWSPLGWQPSIDPSFILTFGQHRCSMCEWLATCVQHERCSA